MPYPSTLGAQVVVIICALVCAPLLPAQTLQQPKRQDQTDVLKVYTELVQTDVMVFDKQGRFAKGLTRDDFELRIDGKVKPIEFFEKITAGTSSEEMQLAAARGSSRTATKGPAPVPLDRGRPIYFYVDDFHLNLQSVKATQKLINHFIEREMGQNDQAAIASTSGQIGFLQQLTDNKAVLRAAVERLKFKPYSTRDMESPAMSEYQALLVDRGDREVTDYYVGELMARNPGMTVAMAESMVRNRSRAIALQAANVTTNTLSGLEQLVRGAQAVQGRKLVFFISDGFLIDQNNSDTLTRLRRITSAAARSGVVIYSMDSRGLVTGMGDASVAEPFDPTGRLFRASHNSLTESQDGLNALANDTGGKAYFNRNSLEPELSSAVKETSDYYLLAWKPERTNQQSQFRRIEVRLVNKPDLGVQVRRGFFDTEPDEGITKDKKNDKKDNEKTSEKVPDTSLRSIIAAAYPKSDLPLSLRLNYFNNPDKGEMVSAAMQVPTQFISFSPVSGKLSAVVAFAGTVLDENGVPTASFNKRVSISAQSLEADNGQQLVYSYSTLLKPGLYQVRVAARDEKSGRAGSAHSWIQVPSFAAGSLTMSSLILGGRAESNGSSAPDSQESTASTELRMANQFAANDFLRFVVFIYNAAPSHLDNKPDVAIQVQVLRDDQPVITAPLKKVGLDGIADLKRIPYGAEIALADLPVGQYLLQVSIVDRVSKISASQRTRFEIQ